MSDETISICALNRIFGFTPATSDALIRELGSGCAVFGLSQAEKEEIFGPFSKHAGEINGSALEWAEKELEKLGGIGGRFVCKGEKGYPEMLAACEDAPAGLYIRSTTPPEELFQNAVSIVGTRDISFYGKEWCENIVRALSETTSPPAIVSGLALGTDITAHRSALKYGMGTIAVMATGIDKVYPAAHRKDAVRISEEKGCALISDYPLETVPKQINFIRRNRIIAGLSGSTVLIESKIKGGGMITAHQAFSYNRNVFALPGRIDDIRSQGCNNLILKSIASPITSCRDLVSALGLKHDALQGRKQKENCNGEWTLTDEQKTKGAAIIIQIKRQRGITLNELSEKCGIPYPEVAELAAILENDGIIEIDLLQRCTIGRN